MLPIELTNADNRNSDAYKEYYVVVIGATPPKTKASIRKTKSSFDTTFTPPPTAAAGPRLSTSKKGKQAAKDSKAKNGDDDDGKEGDDGEEGNDADDDAQDDDDQEDEGDDDEDDQEEGSDDEQASDEEEFIHPSLSTHDKEETRDEESFDPIPKTPENTDDEGNGEENLEMNVGRKEGQYEEDEEDELYRDVNINLGRVAHLPMSASTVTPSTIATITTTQQAPTPLTTALSTLLQDLPNFGSLFGFEHRLKTLEANLSEFMQTNQFTGAVSSIPGIVQRYMDQRMNEAVKVAVQIQSDRLRDEAQAENDESNEQRNLYKALVEAYESDKIILDTYKDIVTLKRQRDDDADKDKEPSAGSDRRSKRRKEGKEPESASAPKEKDTRSTGKSTQGSKSQQTSASESAIIEEPMQTTFEIEEPSYLEFETGADDQPIVEPYQHPEWFSQQKKPPTPDRDWNKTLPATYGSIQPWISELAKQSDYRSSFNELMDTPMDFSAFLINQLKVDTLTLELLAGPTYELMKGSCKSLVELKFFLEKVYKATTDQAPHLRHRRYVTASSSRKAEKSDSRRTLCFQRLSLNVYKKHRNPKAYGRPSTRCRKLPEEAQPNKAGYNKDKQNRLMRIDELHKFSDRTLTDVHTALDDRLKGQSLRICRKLKDGGEAEANYVSLSACYAQVIWMRIKLLDYGYKYNRILMYYDSKSGIAISCNPVQHSRTKHIVIRMAQPQRQADVFQDELYPPNKTYALMDANKKIDLDNPFYSNESKIMATSFKTIHSDSALLLLHMCHEFTWEVLAYFARKWIKVEAQVCA
nr:hypothetical protein [Tanacetum cinerariifolium]